MSSLPLVYIFLRLSRCFALPGASGDDSSRFNNGHSLRPQTSKQREARNSPRPAARPEFPSSPLSPAYWPPGPHHSRHLHASAPRNSYKVGDVSRSEVLVLSSGRRWFPAPPPWGAASAGRTSEIAAWGRRLLRVRPSWRPLGPRPDRWRVASMQERETVQSLFLARRNWTTRRTERLRPCRRRPEFGKQPLRAKSSRYPWKRLDSGRTEQFEVCCRAWDGVSGSKVGGKQVTAAEVERTSQRGEQERERNNSRGRKPSV